MHITVNYHIMCNLCCIYIYGLTIYNVDENKIAKRIYVFVVEQENYSSLNHVSKVDRHATCTYTAYL